MKIEEHVRLSAHTTFKLGGPARFFCVVKSESDLRDALEFSQTQRVPFFIMGGGSNVLVNDLGYKGLVIKMEMSGATYETSGDSALVTAWAGENWDELVAKSVEWNLWGLENLSLIPGTVGASPVQNIGAYGVEVKDLIESVRTIDARTYKEKIFSNKECTFSYRDSAFKKHEFKNYVIVSVTFKLSAVPRPNLSYKDIKEFFSKKQVSNPTLSEIRDAVIQIRVGKFPDLSKIGTAGSFWKNPIISKTLFEKLKAKNPDIPSFYVDEARVKIPLAWILDNVCHFKGFRQGYVGLYEKQPLVLIAERGAASCDVESLADHIKMTVRERTGVEIEREVEYVGG